MVVGARVFEVLASSEVCLDRKGMQKCAKLCHNAVTERGVLPGFCALMHLQSVHSG